MRLIASTLSELLLAIAVPYFLVTIVLGLRVARREGGLGAQEKLDSDAVPSSGGDSDGEQGAPVSPYQVYFLVPCLNEALVIGATVCRLLRDKDCRVIVIDDDSNDGTAAEAADAAAFIGAADRLVVHPRRLPDAQRGKGAALKFCIPARYRGREAPGSPRRPSDCRGDGCRWTAESRWSAGPASIVR